MIDVRILFDETGKVTLPDGYDLGVQGEHMAVRLVITLPHSMVDGASFHVINLSGKKSGLITTVKMDDDSAYRDGDVLYMPLTSAYTQEVIACLSVAAFRGDGTVPVLVDKTPTVQGLTFLPSIQSSGDPVPSGLELEVKKLRDQIDEAFADVHEHPNKDFLDGLTAEDIHAHDNKSVLDGFSESDGKVTYNGKPLGLDTRVDQVVENLNQTQEDVSELKGTVSGHTTKLDTLESNLATTDGNVSKNAEKIKKDREWLDSIEGRIDGFKNERNVPYFKKQKILIEPKDAVLLPWYEQASININPNWQDVVLYCKKLPMTAKAMNDSEWVEFGVEENTDTGENQLFAYRNGEKYIVIDNRWTKDGVPVPNILNNANVSAFKVEDYGYIDEFESVEFICPDEYKTFSRIFNYGDDYGEVVEEDADKYIPIHDVELHAEANKSYLIDLGVIFSGYCGVYLPLLGSFDDASIAFLVSVNSEGQIIDFMSETGLIELYNGQPVDLTEIGYYRVIAIWNPQLNGWCLASAKMEEPS